ncbi:MAG TPA: hypothetical protein VFJ66_07170, partial [Gaiellales bacterium]|nr:hypothetical protein [Gaiellales bacterium]
MRTLIDARRIGGIRRPIGVVAHGVTDYTVGTALATIGPRLFGVSGTPAGRQIRAAGLSHLAYSTVTDYPLGVMRKLPYRAHLAIDVGGALALAATPFMTGQFRRGRSQWLPHVALAVFELSAVLLSDPTGGEQVRTSESQHAAG